MNGRLTTREIVHIDEDKCDGCGQCVPSCAEGAIEIIDGKARLIADNLCDGLGNCLGVCPKDAIRVGERPAEEFDLSAVESRRAAGAPKAEAGPPAGAGGCPGMRLQTFASSKPAAASPGVGTAAGQGQSRLRHWPVQLTLLPEQGEIWAGEDVLLAADCAAYALGDFHDRLLAGRTLAVACPKLDDALSYVSKLARIFAGNDVRTITIARMEVPCCGGLERIVAAALKQSGKDIDVTIVTISTSGEVLEVCETNRTGGWARVDQPPVDNDHPNEKGAIR